MVEYLPSAIAILVLLVLLAPVFGWAAGAVGYAEPLENAAEATGAADQAQPVGFAPFPDYSVAGLGALIGTLLSAVVGTALTLLVAVAIGRVLGATSDAD